MNTPFMLILILCLSGLGIRMIYEEQKKAGKIDPQNKLAFTLALLGMILFLPSWIILCPLDPWRIDPPSAVHWTGIAMAVAGVLLSVIALVTLRGVENIDHLETGGLFRYLRHPMYTGFILWILGWITAYGAMMSLIAGAVSIVCILYWAWLEEAVLINVYGDAYRKYRKTTLI